MPLALITNDQDPYWQDIVSVLAQYQGASFRFRYERHPFDFIGSMTKADLDGEEAIVVLRQWSTGDLIPIRRATIIRTFYSKYLVALEFLLGDFASVNAAAEGRLKEAVQSAGVNNQAGIDMYPLVIHIKQSDFDAIAGPPVPDPTYQPDDFDRWRAIIDRIRAFPFAGRTCFLYAHSITQHPARRILPTEIQDGVLRLTSGETYSINISAVVLGDPAKPGTPGDKLVPVIKLELSSDTDVTRPIVARATLESRYDNIRFVFCPREAVSGQVTYFDIAATEVIASTSLFVPRISLALDFRYAGWQLLSLVLGLGFYFLPAWKDVSDLTKTSLQALGIVLIGLSGREFVSDKVRQIWRRLSD